MPVKLDPKGANIEDDDRSDTHGPMQWSGDPSRTPDLIHATAQDLSSAAAQRTNYEQVQPFR
jgi:hypothetical protein